MRREQFAALSWGVVLMLAAVAAVVLPLGAIAGLGYLAGRWTA